MKKAALGFPRRLNIFDVELMQVLLLSFLVFLALYIHTPDCDGSIPSFTVCTMIG